MACPMISMKMHSKLVLLFNAELDALGDDMLFEDEEVPTYLQEDLVSAPTNELPGEYRSIYKLNIAKEEAVKMGA